MDTAGFLLGESRLGNPDYGILVAYFALMLGIGAYYYRSMKRSKDYFSGGNQIPWWLSGVSFYMSCFSAYGFVVYSGLAFKYGWLAVTMFWTFIPGTLLGAFLFGPRWRRTRVESPVEYLESRYSSTLRQLFAWQGIPVKLVDDALKIVAIGIFLSASLGLDLKISMIGSSVIMLIYTFMGGLWAVVITDFVQFVVMIAGVLVLFLLSILKAGGLEAFLQKSPPGFFYPVAGGEFGWGYIAAMSFMYSLSFSSVHWQLIQRFTCVKDEKEGHRIGYLVTALHLLTPILMYVPAMAARQFLPLDTHQDQVYPLLCATLLPTGLLGLMIAAMFAATMSMLSSDYNVCASVLTHDVYRRLFRPAAGQKEMVLVGRLMTLAIGLLGLAISCFVIQQGEDKLFRTMVKLFSVATAPVAIPMLLGLLWKRLNNFGAISGYALGLTTGLILLGVLPNEGMWLGLKEENIILLAASVVTASVMIVVSLLTSRSPAENQRVEEFFRRISTPIGRMGADQEDPEEAGRNTLPAAFRVVGICIVLVGAMLLAIYPFMEKGSVRWMNNVIAASLMGIGAIGFYCAGRSQKK